MKLGDTGDKPIHLAAIVVAFPTCDDAVFALIKTAKDSALDMIESSGIVGLSALAGFLSNDRRLAPMTEQAKLSLQCLEYPLPLRARHRRKPKVRIVDDGREMDHDTISSARRWSFSQSILSCPVKGVR